MVDVPWRLLTFFKLKYVLCPHDHFLKYGSRSKLEKQIKPPGNLICRERTNQPKKTN